MYYRKRFSILALIILISIVIAYTYHLNYFTLENLKSCQQALSAFTHKHYGYSVALYLLLYSLVAALLVPGAAVLTISGGALFGTLPGALYTIIGATIGSTLAFISIRYGIGRSLQETYKAQLTRFNKELQRNGIYYLFALRLLPIIPFFLVTILAGLTNVSVKAFVFTTFFGIIPGTLAYAFAGQQLALIDSLHDILSPQLLLAFTVLALVSLIPPLIRRLLQFKRS